MSQTDQDFGKYLYIYKFIWNFADCLFIINYMNRLYGKPRIRPALYAVAALTLSLATPFIIQPNESYENLTVIIIFSFLLLPIYPPDRKKKLMLSAFCLAAGVLCTAVSIFLFAFFGQDSFSPPKMLVTHFIFYLCLELIYRKVNKKITPV